MILDTSAVVAILLNEPGFEELLQTVTESDVAIGAATVDAWLRFGKGRHPASLNSGDCLSYAVAKLADESLAFVGDDFTRTDLDAPGNHRPGS